MMLLFINVNCETFGITEWRNGISTGSLPVVSSSILDSVTKGWNGRVWTDKA